MEKEQKESLFLTISMDVPYVETENTGRMNVPYEALTETDLQIVGAGVRGQQAEVVVRAMGGMEHR